MSRDKPHQLAFGPGQEIAFFASAPHDCSYLPAQTAVTVFADPDAPMDMARYSALAELGFRRSGKHVYIPHCPGCRACVPARIPVLDFLANRNQRRTWRQNQQITAHITTPVFNQEHFDLYRRYIRTRHRDGGMDNPSEENYLEFLSSAWTMTEFVEFRDDSKLVAVAVMDILNHGLSCVYTFFDPENSSASLGRYALLWQIEEARRRGLTWVFLGFWINDCKKMQYKQEYRPLELFLDNRWQVFLHHQALPTSLAN